MTLTAGPSDAGKRLDAFLRERLPEFSRSRLQSWIEEDRVEIGGKRPRAAHLMRNGDEVFVEPGELAQLKAEPENVPLKILYEDADVVVIDKPAGMVVHAGAGHRKGTLVNALLHRFETLSSVNGDLRPGIVHRLDRDTSGVLVVARTDAAHQALAKQFHDREVEKTYLALVQGRMKQPAGRVTAPISRDPMRRTRMTARLASGRAALTEYRALEQFEGSSFLEVRIGTGRTHQIRVHLASIGHPIAGDRVYGGRASVAGCPALGRFFLHAWKLRFRSPGTGEFIQVESALPPDLAGLLECLRKTRIK